MKLISNECVHPLFISEGKTTVEDNGADFFIFELVEAIWISNSTLCRKSRVQIIFHLLTQSNVNIIFALIHKEIFLLYVYYLFLFFAVHTYKCAVQYFRRQSTLIWNRYYSKATEEYYSKGSPRIWDLWRLRFKKFWKF